MSELSNIIQSLLEMSKILFLPNTYIVENKDKYKDYFSSIDSKTLLHLVKELKVGDSDTIKQIFGGVLDQISTLTIFTKSLENRARSMNNEIIKIDLLVSSALELTPPIDRVARAENFAEDGKIDTRRD